MMAGAATSQRTAAVPAKAPGAARFSLSNGSIVIFEQTKLMGTEQDLVIMTQNAQNLTTERDSLLVTRDDLSQKLQVLGQV